jgi:hypothetical protein
MRNWYLVYRSRSSRDGQCAWRETLSRVSQLVQAGILTIAVACGGDAPVEEGASQRPNDAAANSANSADAGNAGMRGETTYGGRDGGPFPGPLGPFGGDAGPMADDAAFVGCATQSVQAKPIPLDLYFMLDTSGSMDDLVANGQSKWSQVSAAIAAFASDSASAGLGMGVQYFPLAAAGVPASCSSDAECGASGPCITAMCDDGSATPCQSDDDCFAAFCLPVAACADDLNTLCSVPGTSCGKDANGFALGACQVTAGACANGDSCAERDYETPAVGIDSLSSVGPAILRSLSTHLPHGDTPTVAALQGAIQGAEAYATAHPGHKVVAVLATDGMPNEVMDQNSNQCATASPSSASGPGSTIAEVAAVAAAGLAMTPAVQTFGIGVFTPDDLASGTSALQRIAAAGGTTQPYIITTEGAAGDVEEQFSTALKQIRGTALPCQFQVPTLTTTAAEIPDFSRLNVLVTMTSGDASTYASTLAYVGSRDACDPATGGWYYDADPAQGTPPTAIETCPATCNSLQNDGASRVDIVLGCQTVLRLR